MLALDRLELGGVAIVGHLAHVDKERCAAAARHETGPNETGRGHYAHVPGTCVKCLSSRGVQRIVMVSGASEDGERRRNFGGEAVKVGSPNCLRWSRLGPHSAEEKLRTFLRQLRMLLRVAPRGGTSHAAKKAHLRLW